MKELAEALRRFTNNENARIIDDLVSLIIDNEVDDMDELKELEDGNFVKGLTLENKANEAYLSMIKDVYKYVRYKRIYIPVWLYSNNIACYRAEIKVYLHSSMVIF